MKYFLKGAAVTAIVIIGLMVIHVLCNRNGIQLDPTVTGAVSAVGAMLIYHGLTRKENKEDDQ